MDAAWVFLVLTTAGANWQPADEARQLPSGAVHRTAYFAGQDGWSGSGSVASPPTSSYDRYGQPINTGQTSAAQAPTISARAQNAFTETGTALRDGIEAGIRAGNQQLSNASGGLAPLSSPFATTTNAPPSMSSPARGGVSAPPWPSNSNTTTQGFPSTPMSSGISTNRAGSTGVLAIDGGWTSIGTAIAAPPLLIPQSPMTTSNFGNAGAPLARNGTNVPYTASNDQQPLHSVLAEPARSSQTPANPADDWATGWSNNSGGAPAGISRTGSGPALGSTVRESELVPVLPAATSPQDPRRPAGGRSGDLSAETDPWTRPAQPSLSAATGAGVATKPLVTNGVGNSPPFMANGQAPIGPAPNGQVTGNFNAGSANPGVNSAANNGNLAGRNPMGGTPTNEPQAWMPMIAAVLSLAGSLAANLYLGVSYLDARQKYQSLVRKTADTFRRVKTAAA